MQALYRFYDDGGSLLYVGITSNPGARFAAHGTTKSWWPQVRGISVEWYDTRPEVLAAETRAIALEAPIYNIRRPPLPTGASTATRCGHCTLCRDNAGCVMAEDTAGDLACECGNPTCLYVLAYEAGSQVGWTIANQIRKE
ncbi:GIY-YIG nuclease family protein [Oerskovia enterophila]|uniref:GIY-YIG nuclease family protein n=1 Tax=Oerskovia enterophila TaxID=43678 RepID=UPI003806D1F0